MGVGDTGDHSGNAGEHSGMQGEHTFRAASCLENSILPKKVRLKFCLAIIQILL